MTDLAPPPPPSGDGDGADKAPAYRVLARKYRPGTFAELIGQAAMVRTLENAIENDRLAHAFILTGVRGIGKTTTARLIARALNCTGDGKRPAIDPCGDCQSCRAIAESRDVDVLEMDAASHTGVDDIRVIIDAARYAPVSSRYKIYIIDEVHMLSRNAFNALLKTLEEPPGHVKFIFATTEIRKVPVTVLSRCQRFDLRRVGHQVLFDHLKSIAARERVEIEDAALGLITRAAEGSVRDGLSLLDQAIAHGAGRVDAGQIEAMLGLADRMRLFELYDAVMSGDIAAALGKLGDLYNAGADPATVIADLLEITHWLTRLKAVPEAGAETGVAEAERVQGREMADRLSMAVLARAWQMLLKGLQETRQAPLAISAAEMVLVRLAFVADGPTPGELVRKLRDQPPETQAPPSAGAGPPPPQAAPQSVEAVAPAIAPSPDSFEAVAELAAANHDLLLYAHLADNVRPVSFRPGHIEIAPKARAPADIAGQLSRCLKTWTGTRWEVTVTGERDLPTLSQQREAARAARIEAADKEPLVTAVRDIFPGARIVAVRERPTGPDNTVFDNTGSNVTPLRPRAKKEVS